MMTQRQSRRLAVWLDAEEASLWLWLGFEGDSQDEYCAEQILQRCWVGR